MAARMGVALRYRILSDTQGIAGDVNSEGCVWDDNDYEKIS